MSCSQALTSRFVILVCRACCASKKVFLKPDTVKLGIISSMCVSVCIIMRRIPASNSSTDTSSVSFVVPTCLSKRVSRVSMRVSHSVMRSSVICNSFRSFFAGRVSRTSKGSSMTKTQGEISIETMISARKRAGRAAEMIVTFGITCAGVLAAGLALASHVMGGLQ
jgi:hypothetical protein